MTGSTELSGRSVNWSFDGIYRLTGETISGDPSKANGSVSYTLDPVGNRLSDTSSLPGVNSGSFSYNPDDELASETYDANGNVTAANGHAYHYDSQNELVGMNGGAVRLVYDGDGNRVAKTVNGVTTRYLVDELNPTGYAQVVEETVNGAPQRTYTYGLQRVSENQIVNNTWTPSFYEYDGMGSVRQLTDASGAMTDTYEYDAFGNLLNKTGTTPNEMLYRGEQWDSDLGLYYLRARYYNPESGRFMSRDPGDGLLTNPETLHKYLYAEANPVSGIDPSGRDTLVDYSRLFLITAAVTTVPTYVEMTHQEAPGQLQALGIEISCVLSADASRLQAAFDWGLAGGNGEMIQVGDCTWTFARTTKKPRGHSDPVPWPGTTNPGPDPNKPDQCAPCPPDSPYWPQQGAPGTHGCPSGLHFHWWHYNQRPYPDCTCMPARLDACVPPPGSKPWSPGGTPWP